MKSYEQNKMGNNERRGLLTDIFSSRVDMKKKLVSVLFASVLALSITACGGSEKTLSETSRETSSEVAVVEDGEVEVSQEVQDALNQALEEEAGAQEEEVSSGIVKTVKGEFNGFYDDDSVEVLVEGQAKEYTIGNEEVKAELSNKEVGAAIIFEAQTDTDKIVSIVDKNAVVEPKEVTVSEEEMAAGIVVGSLIRYESDTTMLVRVGEEDITYILSEAAQKDIYDVKVNFGYDVKFQTEGSGDTLTIVNFIYE